jgi:Tol biopolymer transport system component
VRDDAEQFSVAADGTLLMRVHAAVMSSLAWRDTSGALTPVPGGPVALRRYGLALSPDGRRAALVVTARGALNLIVRDMLSGADTPLTANRATDVKGTWALQRPAWFPSGDRLVYATGGVESASRILEQRLDVADAPRDLVAGIWPSIARDGRTLFVINDVRATGRLSRTTIGADGTISTAEPLAPDLDVDEVEASPDGKAAAVVFHGERNRLEIALIALDGGARQRVTSDGGTQPHFSEDGRTLYYLRGDTAPNGRRTHQLMKVPVTSATPFQIGKPAAVFGAADRLDVSQYAVSRDDRLLVAVEDAASRRSRTVLVQNWPALVAGR